MAYKRASDELFIEGAIKAVAENGIENMRTKQVAGYAGFSEATMFRSFPSKEILLRDAFLYIDNQISNIVTKSAFIRNPGDTTLEHGMYAIWHKVYRYLIDNGNKTIFFIRYRCSSLYSDKVRNRRQAYNGGFDKAYAGFEKYLGSSDRSYRGFLINYIFEMTLCFAEKIIDGKLEDNEETEQGIWLAVSSAVKSWVLQQRKYTNDGQKTETIRKI